MSGNDRCPHCWAPQQLRLTGEMEARVFKWWNHWTRKPVEPTAAFINSDGTVEIFWREGGKTGASDASIQTIIVNSFDEDSKWELRLKRTPPDEAMVKR